MEEGSLKFIADENISPVLVSILNRLGDKSVKSIHRPPFNIFMGKPDQHWIPKLSKQGFICVTYDRQMLVDEALSSILSQTPARVIFLGRQVANRNRWDQAIWFLRHWRGIRDTAATMAPGQLVRVLVNGQVKPVTPRNPVPQG